MKDDGSGDLKTTQASEKVQRQKQYGNLENGMTTYGHRWRRGWFGEKNNELSDWVNFLKWNDFRVFSIDIIMLSYYHIIILSCYPILRLNINYDTSDSD